MALDSHHVTRSEMGLLLTETIDTIQDRRRESVAIVCQGVVICACPIRPALLVATMVGLMEFIHQIPPDILEGCVLSSVD